MNLRDYEPTLDPLTLRFPAGSSPYSTPLWLKARAEQRSDLIVATPGEQVAPPPPR